VDTKKRKGSMCLRVGAAILAAWAILPASGPRDLPPLKGEVTYLDTKGLSLEERLDKAGKEFRAAGTGSLYFTGYAFRSRFERNQTGDKTRILTAEDGKIVRKHGERTESNLKLSGTGNEKNVGVILLHDVSRDPGDILDAKWMDLEQATTFERVPMFWLGEAENAESLRLLEEAYRSSPAALQKILVDIIAAHDHPGAYSFLHGVAMEKHGLKVRKSAVFWLGTYKDEQSLALLKKIFGKVRDGRLREEIIFALYLNGLDGAAKELVRIARKEGDPKTRKKAVFWLGQMASEEAVKTLHGLVDREGEAGEVKKSALFAISRFPAEKAVPLLIDIARKNPDAEMRKQAIFWLGQKDSEAALAFFEEILFKK